MIDANQVIGHANILLVTFDSLRYDVARATQAAGATPNLARLLPSGQWEERRTHGTFTFPAHQAFFAGFLPKPSGPVQPTRLLECRPLAGKQVRPTTYVFDADNIVTGLAGLGYRTVCIGGVSYFSRETPLGSVFPDMFNEDYWKPDYASAEPDSTRHQVDRALALLAEHDPGHEPSQRLFLFINVSATHVPHHHYLPASDRVDNGVDGWDSQYAALAYTDPHIGRLLDALPALGDWLIIACSDHGDAFGEDGYTGHGITHPTVYTVPYTEVLVSKHRAQPRLLAAADPSQDAVGNRADQPVRMNPGGR